MQVTPSGVGDVARDAAGASRPVIESFIVRRRVESGYKALGDYKHVSVFFDGDEKFAFMLSSGAAEFRVWVTEEGLEAIAGACMAALVRARIAREQA